MSIVRTSSVVSGGADRKESDGEKGGFCPLPPAISGQWATIATPDTAHRPNTGLLAKQIGKFEKDWTEVSRVIPDADGERYLYYWLVVNTRTFYHEPPREQRRKKVAREDRMALYPFADYFNHADEGVRDSWMDFSWVARGDVLS